MDSMMIPILVVLAGAMLIWWLISMGLQMGGEGSKQRKLHERLRQETESIANPEAAVSVTRQDDESVPAFLARKTFIHALRRKLAQGWPSMAIHRFLLIIAVCAAIPMVVTTSLGWNIFLGLVFAAIFGYVPLLALNMRIGRRQKQVTEQLPEALEFLSRILKAGHSLSTGVQMMGEELPLPLGAEFRNCYGQHSMGQSLEDALRDMVTRVGTTDFSFFVTAVLIQRQTGGDLSEVLNNISSMIRQRSRLAQQVVAKTAEGRFTGYIMVAFPAIMFGLCYFLNPDLYGLFFQSTTGWMMLAAAGFLQILGLFMIKKITTLTV
jgi:tight adherence protein B